MGEDGVIPDTGALSSIRLLTAEKVTKEAGLRNKPQ